jgi:hypothetical protein
MTNKKQTPEDYEVRVIAMKLATQHSRNCSSTTLVKLADTIYKFLKGEKVKNESD